MNNKVKLILVLSMISAIYSFLLVINNQNNSQKDNKSKKELYSNENNISKETSKTISTNLNQE